MKNTLLRIFNAVVAGEPRPLTWTTPLLQSKGSARQRVRGPSLVEWCVMIRQVEAVYEKAIIVHPRTNVLLGGVT
ncbi:MAG: hypothetical protein ABSB35_32735 [Bryobacteraceae bacterium]|jgi:hypothetical protein